MQPESDDLAMPAADAPTNERRGQRRRTYNRRQTDQELSPPYFAVFERIANALEDIAKTLREQQPTQGDETP
jgi:hypothetical protein